MNPEQWLSLKWNGGSTMSDRWLNQSKIIHSIFIIFLKDFAATATIRNISVQMLDTAYDAGIWEFEFLCQSIGSVFLINQIFGIIRRSCLWVGRWR